MAISTFEDIKQDDLAMAVARVLAVANEAVGARGADLVRFLITITEETPPPHRVWRVHYGPRDYVNQRGGDLTILVDEHDGKVQKVLRGQ
jgi:hypothetical protein